MTLRQLFCRHKHFRRERDAAGRLLLVCDRDCGYARVAITRDGEDAQQLAALNRKLAKSRRQLKQEQKAKAAQMQPNVTPMRDRRTQ